MTIAARKFGIEIESTNVRRDDLVAALTAAGIPAFDAGYSHTTSTTWKVVSDGSLSGTNCFELVSPILQGADGIAQVRAVAAVLAALGAQVNKSCGFHVHVDARDLNVDQVRNVFKSFVKYESCFDRLVPPSRRAAYYCAPIRAKFPSLQSAMDAADIAQSIRDLRSLLGGNRYHKLNLEALGRHGTIEFRQHSGTVEAEKMVAWIELVVGFVNRSIKARAVKIKGAGVFEDFLNAASASVRPYLIQRAADLAAAPGRAN